MWLCVAAVAAPQTSMWKVVNYMEKSKSERNWMIFRYSSHSIGQFIIYFYLPRVKGSAKTNRGKKERNEERTKALSFKFKWIEKRKHIGWIWNKRWVNSIHKICYKSKIKMKSLSRVRMRHGKEKVAYMLAQESLIRSQQHRWRSHNQFDITYQIYSGSLRDFLFILSRVLCISWNFT